jgi:hypothetical protein
MAKYYNCLTPFSHWPVAFKNPCPQKQVLPLLYTAIILSHLQLICMEKSFKPNGDLQTHDVWITQECQTLKTKWVDITMLFYNSSFNLQWSAAYPNPETSSNKTVHHHTLYPSTTPNIHIRVCHCQWLLHYWTVY